MSDPTRGVEGGPDPTAEHAAPAPRGGESTRRHASADRSGAQYDHPEAELGGADAVEKTTYVTGEGTEPDARPRGAYAARGAGGGTSVAVWVIGAIAALVALVYAIGVLR